MEAASTRALTLLVTDVVASTELLTTLGDAAGRPLLDELERVCRACVEEHGGTIVKAMGDGLLTTFASTRRAVACAIAIERAVVDNPIKVRVAVHVGEVAEHDGDVLGAAVHVVARLAGVTRGGQIVVSDVVKHMLLATPDITLSELGPAELKGIATPMLLHEVIWDETKTPAGSNPRLRPDVSIVGRDGCLKAVQPAIDGLLAGRGQLVTITGEPGIGKTALATEIARRVERQGAAVVWATCWDGEGAPPLWPWVQLLREIATLLPGGIAAAVGDQRAMEIGRLLGDTTTAATPTTSIESADARFRLFDAVGQLLAAAARSRPLVIVVDDAQWADITSLQLLEFLAGQLRANAVMGIVTYRDVEIGRDHVLAPIVARLNRLSTALSLSGLEPDCVALLVETLFGRTLDDDELAELQRRSLGNPFFVRELAHLGGAAVPDTVREIVSQRIARLPDACRALLTTAALVGQEVDLALMKRITGGSVADLLDQLDLAVAARILVPVDAGVPRWRFAHDLFRETVEAALPRGERAELHQQIGLALAEQRADGRAVPASVLAEHFAKAASLVGPEHALQLAREAATEASVALAYDEAVRWLDRALELAALEDPIDRELLLEITIDHADALTRAGRTTEARDRLVGATDDARRAERPDLLGRVALGVHRLGTATAIPNEDLIALLDAAITAQPPGNSVLLAELLAASGMATYHGGVGRTEAIGARDAGVRAVSVARAIDDPRTLLRALLAYHDTIWTPDTTDERLALATEAIDLASATRESELLFEAQLDRAIALGELGSADTRAQLESCCALAEEIGQPRLRYMALTRRSTLALMDGDLAAAEAYAAEGSTLAAAIGHPDGMIVHFVQLWQIRWLQQRTSEIDQELMRNARTRWGLESTFVQKAWAEIERGEVAAAVELVTPFLDGGADASPFDYIWMAGTMDLALLAAEVGTTQQRRSCLTSISRYLDRFVFVGGCVTVGGAAAWAAGIVAEALGEIDNAIELHEAGLDIHRRMALPVCTAMSQAELARCLTARGSPADRDRARELAARALNAAAGMGLARVERRLASIV